MAVFRMKYSSDFAEHFGKRDVFSIRDARIFLRQKKISSAYLKLLMHNLLKKGKIKRLAKGFYTFKDDLMLAGFAFSPFYYGLHEALSIHKLWGQATNPSIITTRKVRSGIRAVMGNNIIVRRISSKMFFGYGTIEHYGLHLPVSDIEKTFVDFIYFRQKIPAEAIPAFAKRIDKSRVEKYLKKSPKWVRKRVLSFFRKNQPKVDF